MLPGRRVQRWSADPPRVVPHLKANASVDVEVGADRFAAVAEELDETARAELWPRLAARAPQINDHQAKVTRQIPVIMLTRKD